MHIECAAPGKAANASLDSVAHCKLARMTVIRVGIDASDEISLSPFHTRTLRNVFFYAQWNNRFRMRLCTVTRMCVCVYAREAMPVCANVYTHAALGPVSGEVNGSCFGDRFMETMQIRMYTHPCVAYT